MPIPTEAYKKWAEKVSTYIKKHPLEVIFWETTRDCDSYCEYCCSPRETWDSSEELSTDEAIQAFEEIANSFDLSTIKMVSITGGEPLLRKDILYVIGKINKLGFKTVTIQTNGNAIAKNENLIDKILESGVTGIGINIDGDMETHNYIHGGEDDFHNALLTCQRIANQKDHLHFTISTLLCKRNVKELPKIKSIVEDLSPHVWRIIPFAPIGRGSKSKGKYLLSKEDIKRALSFIERERINKFFSRGSPAIEFACSGWLGTKYEGRVRPYIFHCVAGINTMGILYDGAIAACPIISRGFIEGNVKKDNIGDVWENGYQKFRNFEWKRIGDCANCDQWNYCHGGPMHSRLPNGRMLNCIYNTIKWSKDYRKSVPNYEIEIISRS